jgi:hypothetical protein
VTGIFAFIGAELAAEIPTNEPLELVAGDTSLWYKSLNDYSIADGWALKYRLVGASIDVSKTADPASGTWLVTIAANDLIAIVADVTARLIGWVEKGAEKWTVYDDFVRVKPNVRTATDAQLKTTEERTLAVLDAACEGRLSADIETYQISGRAVNKIPVKELHVLRGIYRSIVWRQQNPTASHPTHEVRFRNA